MKGSLLPAAARVAIIVSAAVALSVSILLASRAWQPLTYCALGALVAGAAGRRVAAGPTHFLLIAVAPLLPALIVVQAGYFSPVFSAIWLSALMGFSIASGPWTKWAMPGAWLVGLACFTLVVACTWPIVAARELDFAMAMLYDHSASVTSQGITPAVQVQWVALTAATLMVPVLWLDAMVFRVQERGAPAVERELVIPFALGALLSATVGLYQAFGNISFLNATIFGVQGRAVGMAYDANVFGMTSAIAGTALLAILIRSRRPVQAALAFGGAGVLWLAALSSGSRSALLAMGIGAAVVAWAFLRTVVWRRSVLIAGTIVLGVAAVAVWFAPSWAGLPVERIRSSIAVLSDQSAAAIARELFWVRNGYGTGAVRMIESFPLVGVGAGAFHAMILDFEGILPDNAQNWFRHQLAEFGGFGSLGAFVFALALMTGALKAKVWRNPAALAAAATVLALAGTSLVGMPTQDAYLATIALGLTYWFWTLLEGPRASPLRPRIWAGIWLLAVAVAVGTGWSAVTALRVPYRAERFGWPYAFGMLPLDRSSAVPFRWTGRRSTAVFPAQAGYLRLTFWVHHPDVSSNPVNVRIWRRDDPVADMSLSDQEGRTLYVYNAGAKPWMMIETEVSRTWTPPGETVARPLGLGLTDWAFVLNPPPGATIAR